MQVPVYSISGEVVDNMELNDEVFGVPFHKDVVHQALVRQLANKRQGTVKTKTRSEVAGSGRKPFVQKHTGRARRGSVKSPLLKGGGIIFGPRQRSYRKDIPKKMRRIALRSVLSAKCTSGELKVLSEINLESPKTKMVIDILRALKIDGSTLFVTEKVEHNVIKSVRNIPRVSATPADLLNVADIMSHSSMIMTANAARKAESIWSPKNKKENTQASA